MDEIEMRIRILEEKRLCLKKFWEIGDKEIKETINQLEEIRSRHNGDRLLNLE